MPGSLTNAPKSLRECVCTPVHVCLHVRDEGEEGGRERKGKGKKGGGEERGRYLPGVYMVIEMQ